MEIKILFPRVQLTRELWTVIVVAIILFLAGTGLLYISVQGIYTSFEYSFMTEQLNYVYPAYMLVAAGLSFYVAGLLGVIGVARDSKCIFSCSLTIYLPIILLLAAAGALSHTIRREIPSVFALRLETAIANYDPSLPMEAKTAAPTLELDRIQIQNTCCGRANFTDWVRYNQYFKEKNSEKKAYKKAGASGGDNGDNGDIGVATYSNVETHEVNAGFLPDSCCWGQETCQKTAIKEDSKDAGNFVFKRGCLGQLNMKFQRRLANMCAMATVYLFAVIIILMGMSIIMCKNANKSYYLPVKPSVDI